MAISAAFSICALLAPSTAAKPPAAMEHETPISPWQPISAADIEAFFLYNMPMPAAVSKNLMMLSSIAVWVISVLVIAVWVIFVCLVFICMFCC